VRVAPKTPKPLKLESIFRNRVTLSYLSSIRIL
jgi:hypothetical protein